MNRNYILFLLAWVNAFVLFASNDNAPLGARSAGMGNASVGLSDVWSAHHNQAGLGFQRSIAAGVFYENRFLVKELSVRAASVAVPIKGGTFGLCISNFGYSLYSENKYSLSFAKAFGEKVSGGIALDYLTTTIAEGYGTRGALAAEAGLQAKPVKNLIIGCHIFNPTRAKLADYNSERLPTIIRLGGTYNFSNKVIAALETEKDIAKKPQLKAGIEYAVVKELFLRIGVGTQPSLTTFGFGLNLKGLRIDLSANYHQVLGLSSQFGLAYTFSKKENKTTTTN
jgi:hypothetical protein